MAMTTNQPTTLESHNYQELLDVTIFLINSSCKVHLVVTVKSIWHNQYLYIISVLGLFCFFPRKSGQFEQYIAFMYS